MTHPHRFPGFQGLGGRPRSAEPAPPMLRWDVIPEVGGAVPMASQGSAVSQGDNRGHISVLMLLLGEERLVKGRAREEDLSDVPWVLSPQ